MVCTVVDGKSTLAIYFAFLRENKINKNSCCHKVTGQSGELKITVVILIGFLASMT